MTNAAPGQADQPRRPMKFTDPRDAGGLPQEDFDRHYVDCGPLGGITRQELCPIDCSNYQSDDCPLRHNSAGCAELTTSPSEDVIGDELTLTAVTAERVDVAAEVEDGDGDGCTDPLEPSARASDMLERDGEDEARPGPAQPEPVDSEGPVEAKEPGASTAPEGPHAPNSTTSAASPRAGTQSRDTEGDATHIGEEEPLVAVEDVPDVPVVLDAVEHGSKATDRGVLEVDVPPPASGLIQAADGGDLWNYLTGLVGGDSAPTAGDVTPGCIQTWHLEIEASTRKAVVHACLIGLVLLEQKASLPHGQFKPWVDKQHCSFSYSTVNKYMRVARWAVEKSNARDFSWADLSIRQVDRLLPSPSRKTRATKKETASAPASTTTATEKDTVSSPTDTSAATGEDIEESPPTVAASAEVDGGEGANGATSATPETTEDSADTAADTLDVEAALAKVVEEIKTSPDPQACAKEMISRIAAAAGLNAHAKMKVILLRPMAHGDTRRTVPKMARRPSAPAPSTEMKRTLRFRDLVTTPRTDTRQHA